MQQREEVRDLDDEESLDLRAYWNVLLRGWWILALGVVVAGGAAYFYSASATPIYTATARLLVQSAGIPGRQTASDISTNQQLAQNFTELITTRPVMEQVVADLQLPYGPDALKGKVVTRSPRTLVEISVNDPSPALATEIANAVGTAFIDDFQRRQLDQIARFQAALGQFGIESDSSMVLAQASALSTLSLVEPALEPTSPSSPRTRLNVMLAMVVGLLIAGLIVMLREYLDDTIKSPDEVRNQAGLTTLAAVGRYRSRDGSPVLLTPDHRADTLVESYRFLQTNLEFARLGTGELKSLMVTSPGPGEGKTTTSVNLAASLAREGKNVVLIDADLRRPSIDRLFGARGHKGLSNVLLGAATVDEALIESGIPSLRVLPAGTIPPDPTVVLRSPQMQELVTTLAASADIVILDSPPVLAVADAMLLAPIVDGILMVVAESGTKRQSLASATFSLRQAGTPIVGALLNKVHERSRAGYYYYYYRYSYSTNGNGKRPGRLISALQFWKQADSSKH